MDNLTVLILSVYVLEEKEWKRKRDGLKGVKLSSCQKPASTLRVVEQFNL